MSYAVKYASAYYGPFRDAAESAPACGDRKSYQMDPGNAREALLEAFADLDEGADALIVKPAGPYSDIIRTVRDNTSVPLCAYQVSGEYSMNISVRYKTLLLILMTIVIALGGYALLLHNVAMMEAYSSTQTQALVERKIAAETEKINTYMQPGKNATRARGVPCGRLTAGTILRRGLAANAGITRRMFNPAAGIGRRATLPGPSSLFLNSND